MRAASVRCCHRAAGIVGVVSVVAALLCTAEPAAAEGEPARLALTWVAPEGCPGRARIEGAALASAGRPAPGENAVPLTAEARVARGARWSVVVRTSRGDEPTRERRLEAGSCEALADATAVILATALLVPTSLPRDPGADPRANEGAGEADAKAKADGPTTAADPAAPREAPPVAPPTAPSGREPGPREGTATSERARHAFAASAALTTDGATLPSPGVGGRIAVAWTPGPARLEVSAGRYGTQSRAASASSSTGARFTLLAVAARGCWTVVDTFVQLSPCAGADVTHLDAAGFGAAENYEVSGTWIAAAGGGLLRAPLTDWLAVRGDVDAVVPLSRPEFVVEGDGTVHRPAAVGVRAALGAEISFF